MMDDREAQEMEQEKRKTRLSSVLAVINWDGYCLEELEEIALAAGLELED